MATPRDPFHLVFLICLVLGCGTLLSYNVLVTCATYFNYEFYLYPNIMFIIVPIYAIPNLLFIILMIPFGDRLSWTVKIIYCFIIVGVLVLFIPFLVSSNKYNLFNLTQTSSYYIFLIIVALIGSLSAILQCSVIAFCGLLPIKYLQTLMAGMSVSGIIVCVIRILSKISIPLTETGIEKSAIIYFVASAAISVICAISFYYSKHSAFVQHHVYTDTNLNCFPKLKKQQINGQTPKKVMFSPVLVRCDTPHTLARFVNKCNAMTASFVSDDDILTPLQHQININVKKSYGTTCNETSKFNDKNKTLIKYYVKRHRFNCRKYFDVFKNIWYLVFSIWLSMTITFLWFPGVVTNIQSSFDVVNNDGEWMAIIMITEFNVADYIGRQFVASYTPFWLNESNLWICSLLRIMTYPIFIVFYKGYIVNDYILHITMIISALSHGWIASLSFMWFPRNINKHQQQIAASIMTLGLISGILSGSCIALFIQPYIQN